MSTRWRQSQGHVMVPAKTTEQHFESNRLQLLWQRPQLRRSVQRSIWDDDGEQTERSAGTSKGRGKRLWGVFLRCQYTVMWFDVRAHSKPICPFIKAQTKAANASPSCQIQTVRFLIRFVHCIDFPSDPSVSLKIKIWLWILYVSHALHEIWIIFILCQCKLLCFVFL